MVFHLRYQRRVAFQVIIAGNQVLRFAAYSRFQEHIVARVAAQIDITLQVDPVPCLTECVQKRSGNQLKIREYAERKLHIVARKSAC
jgi:hypothetical protein